MSKLWNGLIEFGTISAAILGISIILKLIKTVVDIVIQGNQLRDTYGYGIALLGTICGSVIHLLLYIKRRNNAEDQTTQLQGITIRILITPIITVDQQPTASTSALNEVRDALNQISSDNLNPKRGGVVSRAPHVP
jgi:hypothetical protein